ncbi:MAG: MYG1 family protein [Myxococcales bacterium]
MITRIVTHPGSAHKDDFLAVSLLLARHPVPVTRRTPTSDELADPAICVVDVGYEHVPERMNFDHHQFPREATPTCSLSLVLRHFGLYEDARLLCDWLEPAEWLDVRGPGKTAEWLGVSPEIVSRLTSPLDASLLRRFGAASEHRPGEPLWEVMRMVGADLLEFLSGTRQRVEFVGRHATLWKLAAQSESFEVVFLPRTEPLAADPSADTERYVRTAGLSARVAAIVYPDRRAGGYGMARFDDHPKLDFCRVAGEPDVHFTHPSGFLCKTSATSAERLQELLRGAWR